MNPYQAEDMKKDKKLLLAYAAGIIDGEGTLIISVRHQTKERQMTFCSRIAVGMNNVRPLDLLYGLFGGSIRTKSTRSKSGKYRNGFVWEISGEKAKHVSKMLLPFLKVKREQAEILIRLQTRIRVGKRRSKGKVRIGFPYRLSQHEVEKRRELYWMMRKANESKLVYPFAGASTKQIKRFETFKSTIVSDSQNM